MFVLVLAEQNESMREADSGSAVVTLHYYREIIMKIVYFAALLSIALTGTAWATDQSAPASLGKPDARHNHMADRSGVTPPAQASVPSAQSKESIKHRHIHPRDSK